MPDEIKSQAEIVAEKLAAADAKPKRIPISMGPPQPSVFQWLLKEAGQMEKDIREATRAGLITADAAKVVFKECVRLMVETQAGEMQKQREAEAAYDGITMGRSQ